MATADVVAAHGFVRSGTTSCRDGSAGAPPDDASQPPPSQSYESGNPNLRRQTKEICACERRARHSQRNEDPADLRTTTAMKREHVYGMTEHDGRRGHGLRTGSARGYESVYVFPW
jgi:hypothetical protein